MRRTTFVLFLGLYSLAPCTLAQTGFPPFGSFEQSGLDAVNRQNLNAIFVIPIVSIPGRGQSFQYSLVNNSLLWTQTGGTPNAWTPVTDATGNPTWGWNYGPAVAGSGEIRGGATGHVCRYIDPDTGQWAYASYSIYQNFSYKDWLGTVHPFNVTYVVSTPNAQANCGINSTTLPISGYSTDNAGFLLTVTAPGVNTVLSPAGVNAGAAPVDSNGNYVSQTVVSSTETDWTDTAGHIALKVFNNTSNIQYKWQDSSGNYTSVTTTTVQLSTLNIKTNFACSGVTEYTGTASLPTEIDLPNGQKYLITYEATPNNSGYYTGRVQRVTFPTGGYYEYDYTGANDSVNCSDGTITQMNRVMNDGTNTSTWTFSRSPSGSNWVTTITAPQMPYDSAPNNSVYTFNASGQQIVAQIYQGAVNSGNLKRTINTTWTSGAPATQITILEDGQMQNEVETSFDSSGNILTLKEHDWGTGTPGSVLRTTTWNYLNSSPYVSANILNRVTRVTVADSSGTVHSRADIAYDESGYDNYTCVTGAAQHNDTNFGCSFTTRGNTTTVTTYTTASVPSGSVPHHSYYDNLGNLVRADLDCCQSKTWSYSATTQYSFPDSSTRGSSPGTQLTSSATYNAYTGLVATSNDENNQVTNYTYDNLKRLTLLKRPDNTQLTWSYNDATPPTQSSVTAGVPIQGSNVQNTVTIVDGLGRSLTPKITDGTTTYSVVATQYDPLGRPYMFSNPYTSSAQYWTTAQFDVLGRSTKTILPDSSQTTFSYTTNTATVTDPAGKARKSVVDGLGRMTSVYEPDPSNGNSLTLQTSYNYNILDLLTGVTQGSQTRTYAYDDLGRATSVQTPETNQLAYQYQYNSFGLVIQRTDPRGVITTYGYDNLNRLTGLTYNVGSTGVPATPSVALNYDQGGAAAYALGRVTSMTDGVGSETYSYNNLGEMTQLQKVISGTTYTMSYAYNLAGELNSVTYPSGRNVQQNFDNIGRLSSIADTYNSVNTTRASGFTYNAAFQVTGLSYGNGVAAAFGYTPDRLLLQSLAYTNGSATVFSTNYWYKTDSTNCPTGASGNNGQIQCISDNVDPGRTIAYSYDSLYRLASAVTNGSANYTKWGLSWTYDRYGNRLSQSSTYDTPPANSVSVDATTNHINTSGYGYDANGNMTNDALNTLVYDAENRLLTATNGGYSGSYTYDGNSLRVKKITGSTTTVYIFSGTKVIAEYDNGAAPTSPSREYIYSGATLVAKIEAGATQYSHQDHLGSARLLTSDSSTRIQTSGGASTWKYFYGGVCPSVTGTTYTISVWVKNQGTTSVKIGGNIVDGPVIAPGTSQQVTFTEVGNGVSCAQLGFVALNTGDSIDVLAVAPAITVSGANVIPTANQNFSGWSTYYGSSVTVTQGQTAFVLGQQGQYPYGEPWYAANVTTKWMFTSYERDAESLNDYAMARSYVNRLARFSSPDPMSGSIGDPQSLNKYSYTTNDPINLADPSGLRPYYNVPSYDSWTLTNWIFQLFIAGSDPNGDLEINPGTIDVNGDPVEVSDPGAIFDIIFGPGVPGDPGGPLVPWTRPTKPVDPLWNALSKLKDLLGKDPDCLTFLGSAGIDALGRLATIMDGYYGQAGMVPTKSQTGTWTMTNAVSFGYPGQLVTVNTVGAFYAGQVGKLTNTTDRNRIPGGSPAAQGFILLHELGHNTDVLKPDASNQSLVDANDKHLEQHCSKTIKALSH